MSARRKWRKLAEGMLYEQWRSISYKLIKGPFEAQIVLPKNYRSDIDNSAKLALDFLVLMKVVPDDSPKYLRRLVIEIGEQDVGCTVILRGLA